MANRNRALGVLHECGNIRAQEVFAIANANDQRCISAGCQNNIGLVFVNYQNRKGAVQSLHHIGEGGWQIAGLLKLGGNKVGGNLGIGLGGKLGAGGQQLGLELKEVLDDAVVDKRKFCGRATNVRVGIAVGWGAVSGPSGVANANVGFR